jgi:hypothetical protein
MWFLSGEGEGGCLLLGKFYSWYGEEAHVKAKGHTCVIFFCEEM